MTFDEIKPKPKKISIKLYFVVVVVVSMMAAVVVEVLVEEAVEQSYQSLFKIKKIQF